MTALRNSKFDLTIQCLQPSNKCLPSSESRQTSHVLQPAARAASLLSSPRTLFFQGLDFRDPLLHRFLPTNRMAIRSLERCHKAEEPKAHRKGRNLEPSIGVTIRENASSRQLNEHIRGQKPKKREREGKERRHPKHHQRSEHKMHARAHTECIPARLLSPQSGKAYLFGLHTSVWSVD